MHKELSSGMQFNAWLTALRKLLQHPLLARSGLSTLAAAYPKAIIQVIIQEFMGHQLVDTE